MNTQFAVKRVEDDSLFKNKKIGNYSGKATQSRCAGRFSGMILPVNLGSDWPQESSHSLKITVMV
jgi:hypothetical protein